MFIAFKLASSRYSQNKANLGIIPDYILFIKPNFGRESIEINFSRIREESWGKIVKSLNRIERVLFLEFGVAWDYATKTLVDLFKENGFSMGVKIQITALLI
jgi:hypothetical protein